MNKFILSLAVVFLTASIAEARYQYQTDFTADDFKKRRVAVYDAIGSNIAIIQGAEPMYEKDMTTIRSWPVGA